MEITVYPKNEQEEKALLAFLEKLNYSYEIDYDDIDTTEYLLSNEVNKTHILESMKQAEEGKVTKIEIDDLFK